MGSGAAGGLSGPALPAAVAALVLEHALQPARVQVSSWHTQAAVMLCCTYAVLFLCCPVSTWPLLHLFVQPRRRASCASLGHAGGQARRSAQLPPYITQFQILFINLIPPQVPQNAPANKGQRDDWGAVWPIAWRPPEATRPDELLPLTVAEQVRDLRYISMVSYSRRLLVKDVRQIRLFTASDIV